MGRQRGRRRRPIRGRCAATDTGTTETDAVFDAACNENSMRVTLADGAGSATFDAFVWTLDDDELVVAGLQTGGEAGCAAVTDIEAQPGTCWKSTSWASGGR